MQTAIRHYILVALLAALLCACNLASGDRTPVLRVWAHVGQQAERERLTQLAQGFNARQAGRLVVELTLLPEGAYNGQVQAAALAGALPDVLEFDGPYLYNYAWAGKLRALDDLLPAALQKDLLPSIIEQGRYDGTLFAVGSFDSGLALYARRSALQAIGARIPTQPGEAWSAEEFDAVLAALSRRDRDGAVLDLKLNYRGEWFTYGFSPLLQSAGGDLIDRENYQSAEGVLNGAPAVAAMGRLQEWFKRGYVEANLDDAAFVRGRVALSWVGHWEYPRYHDAWGEDLLLVPLPDFGQGARTGQGSWTWAISKSCNVPEAAGEFIAYLLQTDEVLTMSAANGAVPGTLSAIARSPLYGEGGALHMYVQQLTQGYAVPRPRTPAYPIISSVFTRAFHDIRHGADVQTVLDRAAALIDQDVADNHGYARQVRAEQGDD
jgi:multiple sugar transport system substrate-binding protein